MIALAGAPVSWGVDFADDPPNPSPSEVLDGIAAAGLEWMELGPPGFLPASAEVLAERGLRSVGTFVFEGMAMLAEGIAPDTPPHPVTLEPGESSYAFTLDNDLVKLVTLRRTSSSLG